MGRGEKEGLRDRPPDKGSTRGGAASSRAGTAARSSSNASSTLSCGQDRSSDLSSNLTAEMRVLKEEIRNLKRELEAAKISKEARELGTDTSVSSERLGDRNDIGANRPPASQQAAGARPKKPTYRPLDMSQFKPDNYAKYHIIEVEEGAKRRLNPFKVFDDIKFVIKGEPEDLTSIGRDRFLVTVRNRQQSEDIKKLNMIASVRCKVSGHQTMNTSKGIIYIREFDIGEEELRVGLQDQSVIEVMHATWIKGRNEWVKPFLLTFATHKTPEHVKIPGESFRTTVYEYFSRPMQCRKCQQYGHKDKKCNSETEICGKCAVTGHKTNECTSDNIKCYHCGESHFSWNRKCPENIFQCEVTKLQTKEKMSRRDAIQTVSQRYPDRKTAYARRVAAAPAPVSEPRAQTKRKLNPASPTTVRISSQSSSNRQNDGDKRRKAESLQLLPVADMECDEETEVLRQIYDSYVPNQRDGKKVTSEKAADAGSSSSKSPPKLNVGMIELTREATECTDQIIKDLEKYKVARMYVVPSDTEATQSLIMSTHPLPQRVDLMSGQLQVPVTMMENFTKQQMEELTSVLRQ